MLGRTDSRRRLLFLLITFAVTGAALLTRLAYWQISQRDRLAQEAFAQTTMRQESPNRRGEIYDRTGVVVLATTVDRERLAAMPSELSQKRRREVAAEVVSLLGLAGDEAEALTARMTSDKRYVVLAHGLDSEMADRIHAAAASGRIEAVLLESEPMRVYPHEGGGPDSTLAAHLLGFVNRDGKGQYGVEQFYDDQLAGMPRIVRAQRDVAARAIPDTIIVEDATRGRLGRTFVSRSMPASSSRSSRRCSPRGPPTRPRASRRSSSIRTPVRSWPRRPTPRTTRTTTGQSRGSTRPASSIRS
jgi:cell division protein FtsI (penicillin-binding protein 3)